MKRIKKFWNRKNKKRLIAIGKAIAIIAILATIILLICRVPEVREAVIVIGIAGLCAIIVEQLFSNFYMKIIKIREKIENLLIWIISKFIDEPDAEDFERIRNGAIKEMYFFLVALAIILKKGIEFQKWIILIPLGLVLLLIDILLKKVCQEKREEEIEEELAERDKFWLKLFEDPVVVHPSEKLWDWYNNSDGTFGLDANSDKGNWVSLCKKFFESNGHDALYVKFDKRKDALLLIYETGEEEYKYLTKEDLVKYFELHQV